MTKGDGGRFVLAFIFLFGVGWLVVKSLPPPIGPGQKRAAQVYCVFIKNGIEQFHKEHRHLPLVATADFTDRDTDISTSNGLVAILLGVESGESPRKNPKSVNYLEGIKPAKLSKKASKPGMAGLVEDSDRQLLSIVDLWGTPYRVRLDTNGDKELANPNTLETAEGRGRLPQLVIVWSAGLDKKLGHLGR